MVRDGPPRRGSLPPRLTRGGGGYDVSGFRFPANHGGFDHERMQRSFQWPALKILIQARSRTTALRAGRLSMTRRRKRHGPEEVVAKVPDSDAMLNAGKDLAAVLQALSGQGDKRLSPNSVVRLKER